MPTAKYFKCSPQHRYSVIPLEFIYNYNADVNKMFTVKPINSCTTDSRTTDPQNLDARHQNGKQEHV